MSSLLDWENRFWDKYPYIAGLDEAGRGAWAGPVVAAAVIFDKNVTVDGVNDSKKLSPKKREKLFEEIKEKSLTYGVGLVDSATIDEINILEASKQAMIMALAQLDPQPNHLFVDGNMKLATTIAQTAIIDGDAKSHSIAAASIIAKVTRDNLMVELAKTYPDYGFEGHKGYGTKKHQEALGKHGCLEIHRKSYRPIRKLFL